MRPTLNPSPTHMQTSSRPKPLQTSDVSKQTVGFGGQLLFRPAGDILFHIFLKKNVKERINKLLVS